MGSGRGQSRRAQAVQALFIPEAIWAEEKWSEFLKSSGLERTKIFSYYSEDRWKKMLSEGEREKLTAELFKDAVAVGAIILSADYEVDDFEFKVKSEKGAYNPAIDVFLKKRPDLDRRGVVNVHYSFINSDTLSHSEVRWALAQIASAVTSVMCADVGTRRR